MSGPGLATALDLERLYDSANDDPGFDRILDRLGAANDEDLADLIEADGRLRIRRGRPVGLDRYFDTVPRLPQRPDPLDAAIDMALRSLARAGRADAESIDALVSQHPDLEQAIRDSAALSNAVWSTTRMTSSVRLWSDRSLPCEFGPVLDDGGHRYQLRELLGEGSFGQVYLAIDRQLSEPEHPALVSIKILPGAERTSWERRRLADEATKARRISHANVVRVLDRGVSEQNEDFVVYEFVAGGDLGKWVRRARGAVNPRDAAGLAAEIARGVHAAHMAGLVHCDLKPNNIIMSEDGVPKVADFGIAIRSEETVTPRADDLARDDPLGNLAFMSPEQFRMEPGALTIPSDVYALGGMLYWLLTGALPNGTTPEAIRLTHDPERGRKGPPDLRSMMPGVDVDLEAICQRALAVRPAARYGSAASLADDLESWIGREPIDWTHPSMSRRARLWMRRKPALAVLSVLVVMIAAVSGAALLHFGSIAREKLIAAAIAEDRAEIQEQARENASAKLGQFVQGLRSVKDEGLENEVLPSLWLLEWTVGPKVLDNGPLRLEIWRQRVETIRRLVEKEAAAGRGEEMQTLQWESALGFWLTCRGEHLEATPLLDRNIASWTRLLARDDPWIGMLRTIRTCADVGRIGAEAPHERAALRTAAAALESAERDLDERASGSPIHVLVLDRLATAYDLLDRPDDRSRIDQRRQALDEQ